MEVPASWVEEASRLKLEYDEERDFHPQVDTDHDLELETKAIRRFTKVSIVS